MENKTDMIMIFIGTLLIICGLCLIIVVTALHSKSKITSVRPKCSIIKIGSVKIFDDETVSISGWAFDCVGPGIPFINVTKNGVLWAEYTLEELKTIADNHGK